MIQKVYTLIFVRGPDDDVLLGYKTRGLGKGLWNGFGGKVEAGETVLQGARRELLEEAHLHSDNMEQVGIVRFHLPEEDKLQIVHVFTADASKGDESPSEEMCPLQWFPCDRLPAKQMWPDASFWLPNVFDTPPKYFTADVVYNNNSITSITNRYHDDNTLFQSL